MTDWKAGDWVVFEMTIGQIKSVEPYVAFSDGFFEHSGRLLDRFRPLTLRNKRIVETFDIYYERLRELDGNAGFNFPDISQYFSNLALDAIDGDEAAERKAYDRALAFVRDARDYKPVIDGVGLFRCQTRRA